MPFDDDDFDLDEDEADDEMEVDAYPWPRWNILGLGIGMLVLALVLGSLALTSNGWASTSIEFDSEMGSSSYELSFGLQEIQTDVSMEVLGETMTESETKDLEEAASEFGSEDEIDWIAWESSGEMTWWLLLVGLGLLGISLVASISGGVTCADKWRRVSIFAAILATAVIIGGTFGWLVAGGGFGDWFKINLNPDVEIDRLGVSYGFSMALVSGLFSFFAVFLLLYGHELPVDRLLPTFSAPRLDFIDRPYSPPTSMIMNSLFLVAILLAATIGGHWLSADLTQIDPADEALHLSDGGDDDDDDVPEQALVSYYAFSLLSIGYAEELGPSLTDNEMWTYEYDYSQDVENITSGQMTIRCHDNTNAPGDQNPDDEMDVMRATLEAPDGTSVDEDVECDGEDHVLELTIERPAGLDEVLEDVFRYDEVSSTMAAMTADSDFMGTWTITIEMDTKGSLGGSGANADDNADVVIDDMRVDGYSLSPIYIGDFPADWGGPED